jgi:transcriptional regulator with XRE-family HTH domain
MNISTIGTIIKKERESCGLTQATLAALSHVSRVTIVNLENGKVGDIGAVKLSEIAENVGISLFSKGRKVDFIKMTLGNINTSYKLAMTKSDLEKFLLSGKIKPGLEGQVLHLIDETPTSLVTGTIKQLVANKNVKAKMVWKNLVKVAADIQSPNTFWNSVG